MVTAAAQILLACQVVVTGGITIFVEIAVDMVVDINTIFLDISFINTILAVFNTIIHTFQTNQLFKGFFDASLAFFSLDS